jgi:peroxiredoxin
MHPVSLLCLLALAPPPAAPAPTYGHSMKGEAFNEGPRQRAKLLPGVPKLHFPITTKSERAQKFFLQGVAQLHAYWWFEAERSFRQAAALDPNCAMAYWGMARANVNNYDRAKGFAKLAWEKKDTASERERRWIEAMAIWAEADPAYQRKAQPEPKDEKEKKAQKEQDEKADKATEAAYIAAMRKLVEDYPLDTEARAFLAHELQERAKKDDKPEVERLLQDVLADNPMHPVHHYRIHLWDEANNTKAVDSAARCGPSEPGSAHMWHMSGHIYSQLKRYDDAIWAQSAASRVDHAHMNLAHLMPDQIFNYAHNNQWLAENLQYAGRPTEALAIARNLVEHPRHPKYNTLSSFNSAAQGQSRLFETLYRYELWDEVKAFHAAGLLEPGTFESRENDRLRLLALATGEESYLAQLQHRKGAEAQVAEVLLYRGDATQFDAAKLPRERATRWHLARGQWDKALALAEAEVKERPNQVLSQAALVRALYGAGRKAEAQEKFTALRTIAGRAELSHPLLTPLAPIAREFGLPTDWRTPSPSPDDTRGFRPSQDPLGPLLWSPQSAPALPGLTPGKPTLVVFSLGVGCERCMTQLKAVSDRRADWQKLGIDLLAVTTDEKVEAARYPFPVLTDPKASLYRKWGAFDDFEKMPLHGLYLIDAAGKIRWQDISFQAFLDMDFLTKEAGRLLAQP